MEHPITTPAFDSQSTFGDSISRLWEPDVASAGLRAGDTEGLITQFTVGSIREPIAIDVKPGSDPNSINCNNHDGIIPVAILTTDDFDATTVDHTTVSFEGAEETHVNPRTGEARRHEEDVDGDGDADLVFHFRKLDTELTCQSTEGTLTGETIDGTPFEGTDSVNMVGGTTVITVGQPIP